MPKLVITTRSGQEVTISARVGLSLMENIRGDVDELLALCGGCRSCATCHVYVDAAWLPSVGAAAGDEDDLLEGPHRKLNSRLSCQIEMTEELDGLRVEVAPEN